MAASLQSNTAFSARLFLALWPDPAQRGRLASLRDRWTWPRGATPVATDKLHMTLHFLGDVPLAQVPVLAASLQVPFTPFAVQIGRDVLWEHGVAVLEPLAAPPELLALQQSLGAVLQGHGIALDTRPYKPHVTLARRAARAVPPPPAEPFEWRIDAYALVRSQDGHTPLQIYGR